MKPDLRKLDNPAWHALTERHACFAQGNSLFKRYDTSIVLFSGYDPAATGITHEFDAVISPGDSFFLFGDLPALPPGYSVESDVECLQMVCEKPVAVPVTEEIVLLNESHYAAMYALVSEVFPGYYLPGTPAMGDYVGIFRDGKLAAIAGERLCMHDLTEISAVVTHPQYTGRKYAQQLMTWLHDKNLQSGYTPFLHTGSRNERAIGIYGLLGYTKRRLIMATKIKRIGAGR